MVNMSFCHWRLIVTGFFFVCLFFRSVGMLVFER